ncbi:MAG: hypothetical protein CBB71_04815 [Rhodopirellula sp. TMED11]|nr:MAG: hypothetical protein CBB71_04815 [Rhodopirellula sp. TMED11]
MEAKNIMLTQHTAYDLPRAADFVAPYFFYATRTSGEVTYVSPSVRSVLGYGPDSVTGSNYRTYLVEGDPLNEDIYECEQTELSGGGSLHALRSVRNIYGERRILSINTVAVSETPGGPEVRRHHIARDVTDSVKVHRELMSRLQSLEVETRKLTLQERDVAERLLQGMMNRDIARELKVSDRTIERRRASIMKHLNAATTPQLVSKLVEHDLLATLMENNSEGNWQSAKNSAAIAGRRGVQEHMH